MAASFGELAQNADFTYVPLSPLLANAFQMLYDMGTQTRQEQFQRRQQKMANDAAEKNAWIGAGTSLGTAAVFGGMTRMGGSGNGAPGVADTTKTASRQAFAPGGGI